MAAELSHRQHPAPRARDARTDTDFDPDPDGGEDVPAARAKLRLVG
ncbi:hypothetical protein OG592_41795 (plasmid) [Streptomyces avidinii]|nr:hypothetical protein OG592_41795 [Streptomyces avidinii]